jgi:polygalacturonase
MILRNLKSMTIRSLFHQLFAPLAAVVFFVWFAPSLLAAPALPTIPAYTTNVLQSPYNAVTNGVFTNTTAIQNAINDVSAKGGGTVEIPGPGVYLTGPLTMKSKINLQIDTGAILRMLPMASWTGSSPLLSSSSLNNLEISGGGSIDGQGGGWWPTSAGSGLYMLYFSSCNTVLVQNVTISNAPKQQVVFKSSKAGNITIQGVSIIAPSSHAATPSHNTDGIDLVGTNCLIQNCVISTGDDNIALGTSSQNTPTSDVLVTNCAFGDGHGMTIGSNTEGGVSNLVVINCTFNGTDCGIRMKSDNATSGGGGQGGIAQNLFYYNLGMTNIRYQPILIYSYYNEDSSPTGITPATAAGEPVGSSLYPIWQNIVISNLTATVASGGDAGLIWARTEAPATNITLTKINITASSNFKLYNVNGLQVVDSQITLTGAGNTFSIYNAQFTITNSMPTGNVFSMDGLAGTNSLALFNTEAAMSDPSAIGINPLTLSSSTLSNGTSLTLPAASVVNFILGTINATVAVAGNLSLSSTINISTNTGFGPGTNTLFTYTGSLNASAPVLGTAPGGYNYSLDTSIAGQVRLLVTGTNNPPVANPSTYYRLAGNPLAILIANLATNWSDSDGNPLTLASVDATSTNGGTVTYDSTNIYYSDANNVTDQFGYTISDGQGGTAQGIVTVLMAQQNISGWTFSNGSLTLDFTGIPNATYWVEVATNLASPANWTIITTNVAGSNGQWQFTDTQATNFPQRFYRTEAGQ